MHRIRLEPCERLFPGRYRLDPQQARHLVKVLRCYTGALVEGLEEGRRVILRLSVSNGVVEAKEVVDQEDLGGYASRVVLLVGLLKADQWDQVLRFSCELGVDQIVPVICERSVPRPDDWHRKVQRYRRILLESTRQCGALRPPTIGDLVSLRELDPSGLPELRLGAFLADGAVPIGEVVPCGDVALAVGPEGDWAPWEAEALIGMGFRPVSLGPRVLRASTAVAAAVSLVRLSSWGVER
ncbi:protein of unknown function DUF558 [Thermanaerovibrio acidaminovorans DSM 6589]|uniref:Ribosomal RNA small subunit methyltransferase E n=1 Tax=Thermanaerovibrio acidaminovorans (strain ATCC 49978 / DSM 6589 / Su883) TaxID=525903 RepID=D1B9A8_THEAS|nr:RsmE family RNA methyltransferase [Thermanaerovibrio acidaminovorans]ACZ18861.1 protein of unknown function DUF558 [Thermanaerovibrio acidaminovorans DSM 6589]